MSEASPLPECIGALYVSTFKYDVLYDAALSLVHLIYSTTVDYVEQGTMFAKNLQHRKVPTFINLLEI